MAAVFVVLEDDAGQKRLAVVGGGRVDGVIIGKRPGATVDDADADLVLALGDGADAQKLVAVRGAGNARVGD